MQTSGTTRSFTVALLMLAVAIPLSARSLARKKQLARSKFDIAERMREELNGRPPEERSRREFQRVTDAFRQVYYTAPTSNKADAAVVAVAELLAEVGRQFKDPKSLQAAVGQYEFLRREYPGSKYRFDALFTIGQIYKDDLNDAAEAKTIFEEFLKHYPHHHLADNARAAIAELEQPPEKKKKDAEMARNDAKPTGPLPLVTGIRHWSTPDYTRVAIDLEAEVKYDSGRIPDPDRIFFDLRDTKLASVLVGKSFEVEDGFLHKIRVAQYQRDMTRVVLEVADVADFSAFLLPNPYRLIIDIHGKQRNTRTLRSADSGAIAPPNEGDSPATANLAEAKMESRPGATGALKSRTVRAGKHRTAAEIREAKPAANGERSLIRALGLKIGKIVVDAGHGGHDTGTIGPNGLQEKDLVLDVALRLGKLLEAKLGADVIYTRDDDTFIPLETRTAVANQNQADLFISIHANSSSDSSARGVETYYLNFTSSADALEVAARENAVSEKSIHELQDLVKKIALKEKIEESREFAANVQQALHTGIAARSPAVRNRGVKKAPFIVLIGANMPSILAEISFLSNPVDERRLETPEYRQKIADYLYRGIAKYVSGLSVVKLASVEKLRREPAPNSGSLECPVSSSCHPE